MNNFIKGNKIGKQHRLLESCSLTISKGAASKVANPKKTVSNKPHYWQKKVEELIQDKKETFALIEETRQELRSFENRTNALEQLVKSKDEIIKDLLKKKNHFDSVSQIDDDSGLSKHPRPDCFKPMAVTTKSENSGSSSEAQHSEEMIVAKNATVLSPSHKRHST